MRNVFLSLVMSTLAVGCYKPAPMIAPRDADGSDLNADGVKDSDQSIGVGHDDAGEPYVVFFAGPQLPAVTTNLWLVGYGGGKYQSSDNDWFDPWAPLVPFMTADQKLVGYAFLNIREGDYEVVPVDAAGFEPYELEGWTDPLLGMLPGDDPDFIVRHVDGPNCPVEEQRISYHYGFYRVGNEIYGLGDSIAPPDPSCN